MWLLALQDSSKQFTAVKSQLQKLQQQLWDREKENVQLQFQYEQAVVDLPRLQVSTVWSVEGLRVSVCHSEQN